MASYQCLNCSTRAYNSCFVHTRRGYSKAQVCFFKILHTISSIPPCSNSKQEACSIPKDDGLGSFTSNNKGIGIDLNLRFCAVTESAESESFAENGSDTYAIEGNNGGIGGEEGEGKGEAVQENSVEVSKAMDIQVPSFEVEDDGGGHEQSRFEEDRKGNDYKEGCDGGGVETAPFRWKGREGGDSNYLDLLIEAAKLVSAKDESNSKEPSEDRGLTRELRHRQVSQGIGLLDLEVEEGAVKKRKERLLVVDLYSDVEETAPVVRSKRGRNQALPYRFRDSVVEPLKRWGRSQTPSSTRKRLVRT